MREKKNYEMAKILKRSLTAVKRRIDRFIAMDLLSSKSSVHKKYVDQHYLQPARLYQGDVSFEKSVSVKYPQLVVYGKGVEVKGGGNWDARSGIIFGEGCKIGSNVNIGTQEKSGDGTHYGPVIIAPHTVVPNGKKIGPSSTFGTFAIENLQKKYGDGAGLFFVVSTGRSGSKAIAQLLNKHTNVKCYHDSIAHINVYACDKMYQRKKAQEIKESLQKIFISLTLPDNLLHGFSDQKLSLLIPEVHEIFPKAKFIWLIRKGDSFVNAAYSRGWYYNREFGYEPNDKEMFYSEILPSAMDAAHRMNAFKMGLMSENAWKNLTAFERNCWYWNWLNEKISHDLSFLPNEQWCQIKLHELNNSVPAILDFLGLTPQHLIIDKVNSATYKKITKDEWNEDMLNKFRYFCGHNMINWFD